ncbi:hypothetical protein [Xylanimonas protaetiae]|uniref:Uncharacterized protein n=1 Tax=Xylanimonas protaetiae TaxID=2509457 RepID=A0A4P6F5H2_9MICO|nr:hypothetical protein [Xylanimonas protaetiae]QAY70013.1 hypothetical protein ET471_08185 [Xylanimonas protaetiae]
MTEQTTPLDLDAITERVDDLTWAFDEETRDLRAEVRRLTAALAEARAARSAWQEAVARIGERRGIAWEIERARAERAEAALAEVAALAATHDRGRGGCVCDLCAVIARAEQTETDR